MCPTTELDAVNAMLASIGESLIDNFDNQFADAAVARDLLTQELRAVQNAQWTFNTELNWTLNPSADGTIRLPQNVVRVLNGPDNSIVQRGNRMYDRYLHTYTFTAPLYVDLVVVLQFDECPEAVKRYVFVRAARKFQDRLESDPTLHQIQSRDEVAAWAALQNFEAETADWNMLDRNTLNQRTKLYRPHGAYLSPKIANNRD